MYEIPKGHATITSDSMLEVMRKSGIFSIDAVEDRFIVTEECDQWLSVTITREQLLALADELRMLAK